MSAATAEAHDTGRPPPRPAARRRVGRWVAAALTVLALLVVVLGTKVVPDGQEEELGGAAFDKATFGAEEFPAVQEQITSSAVAAPELAEAIAADPEAAAAEHGVEAAGNTVYSTTFTGTVGEGQGGIYDVAVEGMPENVTVRIQTGPAINGTELRDATGSYDFGQFTNQIEFQDAGAALNEEMKKQVLDPVDPATLSGKKVTVTGAFTAINPEGWLITPVSLETS
jgi:predicted lipoprotein